MTRPNKLVTVTRIILGLLFTLSGLNHVVALVPMPAMSGDTALFVQGLAQTGYFFPLLGVLETTAGLLLLWGRLVPLALAIIAPIALNVAAFHAVLAPQGLAVVAVILASSIFLAWQHRLAFAPLLRARPGSLPASRGLRAIEIVVALIFLASGVAGLLGRTPPASTAGAAVMMKGLAAAGYFLPFLSAVQIAAGALLAARRFMGLALMALAPLVVQILAYRLYVATPTMLVVGLALVAAEARLAFAYRDWFAPLFTGLGGGPRPFTPSAPVRMTATGR